MADKYKNFKFAEEKILELIKRTPKLYLPSLYEPKDPIHTNDIKKGDLIITYAETVNEYWVAEIIDNMRGNTRTANVHGWFEEAGSIYSYSIKARWNPEKEIWEKVTITEEQLKLRAMAF